MNILVTGAVPTPNDVISQIEAIGHEVQFMQNETDALPCAYEWVEGVICNGLFLSHAIERFVNLRYIQLTSAGYDRVPMEYVQAHDIEIHNARGVYSIPMAEFAIGGVLQLYKQAAFFRENQMNHRWMKHRGLIELNGKTVCIVGCGSVGTECAKRFRAFQCRIIGVDMWPREDEQYEVMYPLAWIDNALDGADIVVLTLPLTDETRGMINAERLAKLKTNSIVVNIARGSVIDQEALIHALEKEIIGGAILDVFEEEPLGTSKLWDIENVLISPHNSFVSDGNYNRLESLIIGHLASL